MGLAGDARFWFLRSKGGVSRATVTFAVMLVGVWFLVAFVAGFVEGWESLRLAQVRNA
jgi:hypothetical protein